MQEEKQRRMAFRLECEHIFSRIRRGRMKLKENKKMTSDRAHLSHVNLGERCKQRKKEEKTVFQCPH